MLWKLEYCTTCLLINENLKLLVCYYYISFVVVFHQAKQYFVNLLEVWKSVLFSRCIVCKGMNCFGEWKWIKLEKIYNFIANKMYFSSFIQISPFNK